MNWHTEAFLALVCIVTSGCTAGSRALRFPSTDSTDTMPELSLTKHFPGNDNSNALTKLLHDNSESRRQENYNILLSTLNMLAARESSEKGILKQFGSGASENHLESSTAEKRARQLSISGALTSLADMLEAERRKQWKEHLRNLGKRSLSNRSSRRASKLF